jgi:hypothetical protein
MEKMKIFISWSGPRSAAVAQALKEYLPMINNAFDPWLSSQDIAKGSRSTTEIAQALAAAKAGIICLTPNNLTAPWILFEAGGVSKTVDKPLACTLLIGLEPSDVSKPLGEFQHTRLEEKELLDMVKTLNTAAGENSRKDAEIDKAFKLCWPELSERLKNLPEDGPTERPERSPSDMFAEILDTLRSQGSLTDDSMQMFQVQLDLLVADIAQIKGYMSAALTSSPGPMWDDPAASGTLNDSGRRATANRNRVIDMFYGRLNRPAGERTVKASTKPRRAVRLDQFENDVPEDGSNKK